MKYFLFLLAVIHSSFALAATTWHAEVGISDIRFDEYNTDDSLFVREKGQLYNLGLGVTQASGPWHVDLAVNHKQGNDLSHKAVNEDTSADYRITRYRLDLGYQVQWASVDNRFRLGVARRDWERDIRGTEALFGLEEDYQADYLALGYAIGWSGLSGSWSLSAERQFIHRADMTVKFLSGQFDRATLNLDDGYGWSMALNWAPHCETRWCYQLELGVQRWWFDRSPTEPLRRGGQPLGGGVAQPENETTEIGLSVRWKRGTPAIW